MILYSQRKNTLKTLIINLILTHISKTVNPARGILHTSSAHPSASRPAASRLLAVSVPDGIAQPLSAGNFTWALTCWHVTGSIWPDRRGNDRIEFLLSVTLDPRQQIIVMCPMLQLTRCRHNWQRCRSWAVTPVLLPGAKRLDITIHRLFPVSVCRDYLPLAALGAFAYSLLFVRWLASSLSGT